MVLWLLSLYLKDEPVAYLIYTHYINITRTRWRAAAADAVGDASSVMVVWCLFAAVAIPV